MPADWIAALGLVLSATCVALASLLLLAGWQARRPRARSLFASDGPATVFLFDGDRLLDATPAARSLLPEGEDARAWSRLLSRLGPMFPGLPQVLEGLPRLGQVTLTSGPGVMPPVLLRGEHFTGLTKLTMIENATEQRQTTGDSAVMAALQQELAAQRAVLARAPVLMWREGPGGVVWANHAYLIRAAELLPPGEDLSWPLPRLFPEADFRASAMGVSLSAGRSTRTKLQMQGGAEWFDLVRMPVGEEVLCYALAANSAVQAETALRDFMQTLTKTFADLPIGLAIFDRQRVLQLFNPALADLTSLAPDFLISRPTLSSVLDAMRAKAMIPEPKDYRSWRKQLVKLEEEASMGLFEETWSLPGGQTYRVIGRPHPNGALALMFEDISHEMTQTRRYRADLELGQSVIDAVEEGVAVFSQGGQLVMSNIGYAQLWNHDPAVLLSDAGIGTLCAWWREHSAPTLLWDDATDFVTTLGDRTPWDGEARMLDGRLVTIRFRPLTGGATLITFRARGADVGGPVLEHVNSSRLLLA
ncbi:MAG: diguanylate cyclase [Rhodobacteraceae bacterium]|nr:diguanylate cyclase [Paracoccaceae bacterium]